MSAKTFKATAGQKSMTITGNGVTIKATYDGKTTTVTRAGHVPGSKDAQYGSYISKFISEMVARFPKKMAYADRFKKLAALVNKVGDAQTVRSLSNGIRRQAVNDNLVPFGEYFYEGQPGVAAE